MAAEGAEPRQPPILPSGMNVDFGKLESRNNSDRKNRWILQVVIQRAGEVLVRRERRTEGEKWRKRTNDLGSLLSNLPGAIQVKV